jgi:hypothetical protein
MVADTSYFLNGRCDADTAAAVVAKMRDDIVLTGAAHEANGTTNR